MLRFSKSEIEVQNAIEVLVNYFNLDYFDFLMILLELKEKQLQVGD